MGKALGGERNPGGTNTSIFYGFMTIPGCYIFMNDSFFSRSETFFEIKGCIHFSMQLYKTVLWLELELNFIKFCRRGKVEKALEHEQVN